MKFVSSKKIVPTLVAAVAIYSATGPVLVFGQVATQQCAYPLDYTQSLSDAGGVITASFVPTPNQGGYLSELHHVQLHVSKNCKASMAADKTYDGPDLATTEITSSSGQCSFPWFQGPFDKESTSGVPGDWSAINVKLSLDSADNTPGAGVITNGNYYFSVSDAPLKLQAGDILCYDFTYHFKGDNIDTNKAQCNTGICAPGTPPTQPYVPPSIRGDPQFTGFQGQNFQVHGVAGSVYNTFTSSSVQVNSEFVFLTSGHCDKEMNTLCFGHPGSYIGGLGITIKNSDNPQNNTKILIQSGRWNSGLHVHVNDKELESTSANSALQLYGASIRKISKSAVSIHTPTLSLNIVNSDKFLNMDMDLNDKFLTSANINTCEWPQTAPFSEPHGLMGQTWCLRKIQSDKIEGEIDDYFVQDGLFGTNFQYNKF